MYWSDRSHLFAGDGIALHHAFTDLRTGDPHVASIGGNAARFDELLAAPIDVNDVARGGRQFRDLLAAVGRDPHVRGVGADGRQSRHLVVLEVDGPYYVHA